MFIVLAIYFGTIFYSVKKLLEVAKKYEYIDPFIGEDDEEETQIQEQNYSLENIKVDKENILYQAVNNEINNNQLDTTKKVLICCTGDYQSMALLTIAMNIFNRENIHVFTFNRNHDSMLEFMENICNENKLAFYHSLCDKDESELDSESNSETLSESNSETLSESDSEPLEEQSKKIQRYTLIKDIVKNNDIHYVFEAHTLVNYSNMILNDLFENKKTINDISVYRPFLLIDNITLMRFFSSYNIPIDINLTNLEYSREDNKILFNNMEQYISVLYPNWRLNVVENNKTLLNTDELKKYCYKGKHGFSVEHNFDKISFVMFKKLVDELAKEYKFENDYLSNISKLDELYMNDNNKTLFLSENYLDKISIFERYLLSIDLQDLVEDLIEKNSNISENSFEELDTNTEKLDSNSNEGTEINLENTNVYTEQEQEQDNDKEPIETKETSSNCDNETNKECIIKVDLNNSSIDMKIVDSVSDNFKNEYLEGIIYISIENDNYHIFDVNYVM
jgi:hypothetical protein